MKIKEDLKHIHDSIGSLMNIAPVSKTDEYDLANELNLINRKLSSMIGSLRHWDPYEKSSTSLIDWDEIIVRNNKNFRMYMKQGFPKEAIRCYVVAFYLRDTLGLSVRKCAKILNSTESRFNMLHNRASSFKMNYYTKNKEPFDSAVQILREGGADMRGANNEAIANYLFDKFFHVLNEETANERA